MTTHDPDVRHDVRLGSGETDGARTPSDTPQYSPTTIRAIWASVTVPIGVLAFVVTPAVIPRTSPDSSTGSAWWSA